MSANHVIVVVIEWMGNRVLDRLQASKVHYSSAIKVGDRLFNNCLIANVSFNDGKRSLANFLHALERFPVAVAEIVQDGDLLTGVQELDAGVRSYISSATGDQNHSSILHFPQNPNPAYAGEHGQVCPSVRSNSNFTKRRYFSSR